MAPRVFRTHGSSALDSKVVSSPAAFKSILVDVDAAANVHHVLDRAVRLARGWGARLRIVDVVPGTTRWADSGGVRLDDMSIHHRRARLRRLSEAVRGAGVGVDWDLLAGPAATVLVEEVRRRGHDLLMRSHSRDLVVKGLGTVDAELFRTCPCPVWAAGYGAPPARPRIVAALGGTSPDRSGVGLDTRILEVAAQIARAERGAVTLLHAWSAFAEKKVQWQAPDEDFATYLDAARRRVEGEFARLATTFDGMIEVDLRRGEPEHVIPAYVIGHGVDVLVVGSRIQTGIRSYVSRKMAERMLRALPCSVVSVTLNQPGRRGS